MGGFKDFLGKVGEFAGSSGVSGAIGIAGFAMSIMDRKQAASDWAKQKKLAKKTGEHMVGSAGNVVRVYAYTLGQRDKKNFGQQKGSVLEYAQQARQFESAGSTTGLAGQGTVDKASIDHKNQFAIQQYMAQLEKDNEKYTAGQEAEREVRDIENQLLQLNAVSGKKASVLDLIPKYRIA